MPIFNGVIPLSLPPPPTEAGGRGNPLFVSRFPQAWGQGERKMLLNFTPHVITLIGCGDGDQDLILISNGVARVQVTRSSVVHESGLPCNISIFGDVTGLPEETVNTWIIVSRLVMEAVKASGSPRGDLLMVDETVRDEKGAIIGARSVAVFS